MTEEDRAMYNRELCAYDEKIALSKVEVAKARERTAELVYDKARYILYWAAKGEAP